jgi:transposase
MLKPAARVALPGRASVIPKTGDGPIESIRVLRSCRCSAVTDRTAVWNRLQSLIDTSPDPVRNSYRGLTKRALITKACRSRPSNDFADPVTATAFTIKELAKRWAALDTHIAKLDTHLSTVVAGVAPNLITRVRVKRYPSHRLDNAVTSIDWS